MTDAHAAGPREWVVQPGESIQHAVDRAAPGDTIDLLPGTYTGGIEIAVSHLTLRGAGSRTVITPGGDSPGNACARAGNAICVTGTAGRSVTGVGIDSLAISGFKKNGVWASWTDGLSVRDVTSRSNGQYGFSEEHSTRSLFADNTAEDNGQAGIFLANTVSEEGGAIDTEGSAVRDNLLAGNHIGVVIRRARHLTVADNTITGNCGGVFLVGDENVPRGGDLVVSGNDVHGNNKYCPASARLPFIQGSGILLTGVYHTVVTGNRVTGNAGRSPMSGGIVLYPSNASAVNTGNLIIGNLALDNAPGDIAYRSSRNGTGNVFSGNVYGVSEPADLPGAGAAVTAP